MTHKRPDDHRNDVLDAAKREDFSRVGDLLRRLRASDLHDSRVAEAFLRAAIADEVTVVAKFLAKGINVNVRVKESTALGASSLRANVKTVRLLVSSGADVNQRSKEDDTPLIAVCRGAAIARQFSWFKDHEEAAALLLDSGADPNAQNISGMCALHYSVQARATRLCTIILNAGGDVSLRDVAGATALEYAAVWGDIEIAELLIERGANVRVTNALGVSPLYAAAAMNRLEIARVLLYAGADPNVRDLDGGTAVDVARREGYKDMVRLLTEPGEAK